MTVELCERCGKPANVNPANGTAYCGYCNHEWRVASRTPTGIRRRAVLVLRDGNRNDVRIETAVSTASAAVMFDQLRDAVRPYWRDGLTVMAIYFYEENLIISP